MPSAELRSAFLEFFRERGHAVVPSSPLVPGNDPTLLFTNAGMVQFKDVFLGKDQRSYKRAVSSQRCVRAGGKHNDLENVGYTARHHTFFEMLGNFSFGDYFKREAIEFAWDFVTGTLAIPAEKLWVTVYKDDPQAADIWLNKIGVDPKRFTRMDEESNFWAMGDSGPCGPCSEIFYDHGKDIKGGPPGSKNEDGDRYVEIWNLVFMQYERSADGKMTPLPRPSVDTGMGLERTAAVMQGVHSNYDIDLFQGLIAAAAEATHQKKKTSPSLRVIADHIRACSFLIVDGVIPGNEGRGYVLRRIIRRAIRHGYKLGQEKPFFHQLVPALAKEMGEGFPELVKGADHARRVLRQEEERFAETLENGMELLEGAIKRMKGKTIAGETVFKLYDTFGFPVDVTADIARERKLSIDQAGFEKAMESQRERGRAASRFGVDLLGADTLNAESSFCGYDSLVGEGKVTAILKAGAEVKSAAAGDEVQVVLDRTSFYAESGGQVGDIGVLENAKTRFKVTDTKKLGDAHLHIGRLETGSLAIGDKLTAKVDAATRQATVLNHSATHLLHAALRKVLGTHVLQKGSLVAPDRMRFDFSHTQAVTPRELESIEDLVNSEIRRNSAADIRELPYDAAIKAGAMALFGEKYGDVVRVLRFGDFSTELCGGTHVARTGDIGLFRITSEGGIASGVRRIEAVTGEGALESVKTTESLLRLAAAALRSTPVEVEDKVNQLLERQKKLERELATVKSKLTSGHRGDLAESAVQVRGVQVVATAIDGADAQSLREAVDSLKGRLGSAVIVLATVTEDGKVSLVAGVTPDLTATIKAGDLVGSIAAMVGGRGGGRPDFAQAGGSDPSRLVEALAAVRGLVEKKLAGT
ncbi:MAG: alanine--tRNA ligase [Gammaproteobacteria bacterium]|nr:alanine--tRNA ligase [Gammaproteobacteria bacterium]